MAWALVERDAPVDALCTELTGPPPTVLVVDDARWADDATLDVLGRFPQRPLSPAAVATLASGTTRDGPALHALIVGNPFFVTEALATGARPCR